MRFTLRQQGVHEVLRGQKVEAYLRTVGETVQETIESQASSFAHTRHFAESIEKTPVKSGNDGPTMTVYSTDWFAHGIEYGSVNNVAYAPFRRACAALGLRLKGGGERR